MKYYITYKIDARYTVEVEANDLDEAKKKADAEITDVDFGAAEDIDSEVVTAEDEEGYTYY